jgi:hypothetical protein
MNTGQKLLFYSKMTKKQEAIQDKLSEIIEQMDQLRECMAELVNLFESANKIQDSWQQN